MLIGTNRHSIDSLKIHTPKPASPKGKSLDQLDSHLNDLLEALFKRIAKEGKGAIRIADTEKIVAKLSSRLGQNSALINYYHHQNK